MKGCKVCYDGVPYILKNCNDLKLFKLFDMFSGKGVERRLENNVIWEKSMGKISFSKILISLLFNL